MKRWRVVITWTDDEGAQHCRTHECEADAAWQAVLDAGRAALIPARGHNMLVQELK